MMDVVTPENLYHNKSSTPKDSFCYWVNETMSPGTFLGDNPLDFPFPLLLYQIIIIFIATRLVHGVLSQLSLPLVISQIVAGLLLGPSFLGQYKAFEAHFFKPQGWVQLNMLGYFSFMLFNFLIGVKTDVGMVLKSGKKALAVAIIGNTLPFLLFYSLYRIFDIPTKKRLPILFDNNYDVCNVAIHWSMTSYIVLSCALGELNLLTSKLGRLAMSASLISAIFSTFLYGFFLAFRLAENGKGLDKAIYSFLIFIGISITLISVARVFVVWLISKAPESRFLDEARFITILMIALAGCLATEIAGYHGALGAFIFGLALPGGAPLGVTMVERLDRLVTGIFLPVFVALAGIRMDLITLFADMSRWGYFQAFVSVSVVGKFVGTIVPCLYFKMHWKDAMILGLIMNIKGIHEIDYSAQWQDTKIVDNQEYTILMSSVIFLGGATSILVKYFYRPEDRFVAYKRRTIYHSKPGDELRIVSCIHSQSDVSLTLSLLDASYPTTSCPLCVYLIHLMELAGRTEAILRPHKVRRSQTRKINSYAADSDRIVNAFNAFERQNTTGSVSMIPYICISPYNTMHEDICSLAYDKKTVLVLIPFHQRYSVNGTAEPHNPSLLNLNLNVLSYAPCSVGILIDRGGSTAELLNHQVAMYFMGGRDDREALALATRMADNPAVGLTVMRFRKSSERGLSSSPDSKDNDEERLDEEVIDEFIRESVDNQRVVYREDVVKGGDELVDAIRQNSGMFSLLIVGRNEKKGKAKESCSIMAGLSAWSENPELGVLGDLLASTDFGCIVPTLVVQQQALIGNCVQQSDDQVSHLPDDTP